ncbi:hypothetical protein NQ317_015782 [Molorchus minor]|uniref:Anamorsin homolog n=1 Tax=Molorchus minor TaxID=1323400 RepID=A0ABQ9J5S4_9CUCU|nr:hypothetical protein NQ317_015782 [Molorchus minor]
MSREMEYIKKLNISNNILIVCEETEKETFKKVTERFQIKYVLPYTELTSYGEIQNESLDSVLSTLTDEKFTNEVISKFLTLLKPSGKLVLSKIVNYDNIKFNLSINGFMHIESNEGNLIAEKPKFKAGSSAKINLPKKSTPAVWKLDDNTYDDLIDPDDLLDEDDLKKPDPASLRVCGTTGKRKACKDCSCGLAEELLVEAKEGKVIDTKDAAKSSCGSCYLGDAFRCGTCPYLGMPAFKPGEKNSIRTIILAICQPLRMPRFHISSD